MVKKDSSPSSKLKHLTPQQEVFEREAHEKLEHADMDAFDRMMKSLVNRPKYGRIIASREEP